MACASAEGEGGGEAGHSLFVGDLMLGCCVGNGSESENCGHRPPRSDFTLLRLESAVVTIIDQQRSK